MGMTPEEAFAQALGASKSYTKKSIAGAGAIKGDDGKSAYEIAVDNGFVGTEEEWLASLKGEPGTSYDDTEIKSEINDIWKAQGELGAKNLLVYPYSDSKHKVLNGIEYTDNDGAITANGAASEASSYVLTKKLQLKAGKYKIADFCQRNGSVYFNIDVNNASGGYVTNIIRVTDGLIHEFEITSEQISINAENDYSFIAILYISNGVTIDNFVFYPMIWHAEDTDDTWQPYVPTNRELNKRINDVADDDTEIKAEINDIWKVQGEVGSKNLLVYPYAENNKVRNGVTWVANNDGSIAINGQIGSEATYSFLDMLKSKGVYILPQGSYLLSVEANKENAAAYVEVRLNKWDDKNYITLARSYMGQQKTFDITAEMVEAMIDSNQPTFLQILAQVSNTDEVFDDLIIYPMIRLASDTDDTWQPYAPTNKQLYDMYTAQLPLIGEYLQINNSTTSKKRTEGIGATQTRFWVRNFMQKYGLNSSDLNIEISAETSSGNVVAYNRAEVNSSDGYVYIYFDELTEAATFICKASKIQ